MENKDLTELKLEIVTLQDQLKKIEENMKIGIQAINDSIKELQWITRMK